MNIITFAYKMEKQKTGYFVNCLDWEIIFSEGENIEESKNNVIELTEMYLELLFDKKIKLNQKPNIKKHLPSIYIFNLSFDIDKRKYLKQENIFFKKTIKEVSKIAVL